MIVRPIETVEIGLRVVYECEGDHRHGKEAKVQGYKRGHAGIASYRIMFFADGHEQDVSPSQITPA